MPNVSISLSQTRRRKHALVRFSNKLLGEHVVFRQTDIGGTVIVGKPSVRRTDIRQTNLGKTSVIQKIIR